MKPQVSAHTRGVFCGRTAARMLTWALPGNAKGIYYLAGRGNTSFGFTYVHRVRAVGQFEMNNRPQNTKPPLSNGERRFCVGGRWRLHGGGALPQRRGCSARAATQRDGAEWGGKICLAPSTAMTVRRRLAL